MNDMNFADCQTPREFSRWQDNPGFIRSLSPARTDNFRDFTAYSGASFTHLASLLLNLVKGLHHVPRRFSYTLSFVHVSTTS